LAEEKVIQMQDEMSARDLKERLDLIQSMIAEGRCSTERWGWVFVLWGVAYCVAIMGSGIIKHPLVWPVTMISACVLTAILISLKRRDQPSTKMGQAIGSIWIAAGISMFLVFLSLGTSGRIDQHIMVAVLGGMLGSTNAASAMILKWKMQFACAVVWWACAVFACFGKGSKVTVVFLASVFFCQIVFGIYAMMGDSRRRRERGVIHA
jgi:hypothetical protein